MGGIKMRPRHLLYTHTLFVCIRATVKGTDSLSLPLPLSVSLVPYFLCEQLDDDLRG